MIKHISVLEPYRNQGIGRALVNYVFQNFHFNEIEAETDEESVGFYRSLHFSCRPFQGKYNQRYHCISTGSEKNKINQIDEN